jgi:hypothetical protein
MLVRFVLACMLAIAVVPAAYAEGGPALITVVGQIDKPNRGPMDPFTDELFAKLIDPFDKAHAFDLADLQALPQHEMTVTYADWKGVSHSFRGPLVAEVLAAAGATGSKVLVMGIDGYSSEHERAVLEKTGFILALSVDGQPLGLGGHGPAWLMVAPDVEAAFPDGKPSLAGLAWAVVYIQVD